MKEGIINHIVNELVIYMIFVIPVLIIVTIVYVIATRRNNVK